MSAWQPMWDKVLDANPIADAIALDLDYRRDRYRALDSGILVEKPWADIVNNYSAPAGRTYFDSSGVLQTAGANEMIRAFDPATGGLLGNQIFGTATNLFINSNSPATQSISVTAQTYTLSIYGTGSVTLSGASVGVLNGVATNQRQTLTFTTTAGSLTLTVSGAVVYPQLQTGTAATPYVQTGGSPVTIAAENQIIDGSVFSDIWGAEGNTILCVGRSRTSGAYYWETSNGTTTDRRLFLRLSGEFVRAYNIYGGTTVATATFADPDNYARMAYSAKNVTGDLHFAEGGVSSTFPAAPAPAAPDRLRIGSTVLAAGTPINGYIERLVVLNRALPPSILQRLTA